MGNYNCRWTQGLFRPHRRSLWRLDQALHSLPRQTPSARNGLLGRQSLSPSPGGGGRRCCFHSESGAQCPAVLYREVLGKDLDGPVKAIRAKSAKRLPTVLAQQEALAVIERLSDTYRLAAQLLYGSGLRLMECMRLRQGEATTREVPLAPVPAPGSVQPPRRWSAAVCGSL